MSALQSSRWAISGPADGSRSRNETVAETFAAFVGAEKAVFTSSGSSAIETAVRALDLSPGAEVLVPAFTWIACASAVLRAGCVPVCVDIGPGDSLCMDPMAAEQAVTKSTEAVLLVHLCGHVADIRAFQSLTSKHRLALIEDCAQAHGAKLDGQHVGTFGDLGVFSFQNAKLVTSGEGGAVVGRDSDILVRAARYRADGRDAIESGQVGAVGLVPPKTSSGIGANHGLTEFQAVLIALALRRLPSQAETRQSFVDTVARSTDDLTHLTVLTGKTPGITPANYQLAIRSPSGEKLRRHLVNRLGTHIEPTPLPLAQSPLLEMSTDKRFHNLRYGIDRHAAPNAVEASNHLTLLPHRILLADRRGAEIVTSSLRDFETELRE